MSQDTFRRFPTNVRDILNDIIIRNDIYLIKNENHHSTSNDINDIRNEIFRTKHDMLILAKSKSWGRLGTDIANIRDGAMMVS